MPPCMSLERIFPKFVRTYGTCMHHDKSLFNTCIVPPLINFLLGYVTLIHYGLVSQKLYMLMVQMAAPVGCENFLMVFGTPTLLWRVLHFAGYHEPPLNQWNEEYLEGQPWYEVWLTIQAHT